MHITAFERFKVRDSLTEPEFPADRQTASSGERERDMRGGQGDEKKGEDIIDQGNGAHDDEDDDFQLQLFSSP